MSNLEILVRILNQRWYTIFVKRFQANALNQTVIPPADAFKLLNFKSAVSKAEAKQILRNWQEQGLIFRSKRGYYFSQAESIRIASGQEANV